MNTLDFIAKLKEALEFEKRVNLTLTTNLKELMDMIPCRL